MPEFGARSKVNLGECHIDLQKLFKKVVENYDCSVIEGYRSKEEQNTAFDAGKSKLQYPKSKHNRQPSLAVDVCPYPIDWENSNKFYHFAGYVLKTADELNIKIRWGGDWDGDGDFKDQNFHDLPHFELI